MKNLEIIIKDITHYDPENGETGGGYWFAETYRRTGIDQWEVSYSTSSIFRYCPYCGSFIGENSDCSCMGAFEGQYMTVSDHEVIRAMDSAFKAPENYEVMFGTYEEEE